MNFEGTADILIRALTTRITTLESENLTLRSSSNMMYLEFEQLANFLWPDRDTTTAIDTDAASIIEELKRRGIGAGGRE